MNWMAQLRRLSAAVTIVLVSGTAFAQSTPAMPGDPNAEKYFPKLIEFPETQGDANVRLFCQAMLKKNGKVDQSGCAIQNAWEPDFASAVAKGAKKAQFVPATIDGDGIEVLIYFQVEFLKTQEDGESINVYMNSAITENVEEYGENYIEAQRVFKKIGPWAKICPKRADWILYALAHIDEQGTPSSVNLEHGGGIVPTGECQSAIIEAIESSRFIPAIVDGVPVPSSYIEPFGN